MITFCHSILSTTKTSAFDTCIYVKNLHLFFLGITSFLNILFFLGSIRSPSKDISCLLLRLLFMKQLLRWLSGRLFWNRLNKSVIWSKSSYVFTCIKSSKWSYAPQGEYDRQRKLLVPRANNFWSWILSKLTVFVAEWQNLFKILVTVHPSS